MDNHEQLQQQHEHSSWLLQDFQTIVRVTMRDRIDINQFYSSKELQWIDEFERMNPATQQLYLQLFHRKGPWFRSMCSSAHEELFKATWFDSLACDNICTAIEAIETCFHTAEMNALVDDIHGRVKSRKKIHGKAKLLSYIRDIATKQKRLDGSSLPLAEKVRTDLALKKRKARYLSKPSIVTKECVWFVDQPSSVGDRFSVK